MHSIPVLLLHIEFLLSIAPDDKIYTKGNVLFAMINYDNQRAMNCAQNTVQVTVTVFA